MTTKPPTLVKPAARTKLNVPSPPRQQTRTPKTFAVQPLSGTGEGEKLILYGQSGLGKTTLLAQVPNNVFIPVDDGARRIKNPLTDSPVSAITPVESWDDLRDAVRQSITLIPKGGMLTIDTLTRVQPWGEAWVVANVPVDKGGRATNIEAYGWGKGFRHVLDQIRLLLTDLDAVIRSGRHVCLICQVDQEIVPNAAGADYYQEVPKLIQNKQAPIRTEVCEWADHVFRIGFLDGEVTKESDKARAGKVTGTCERAIFTGGARHFVAKSRPIDGYRLPAVIGFDGPTDNSLWQFVLEGAQVAAVGEEGGG